MKKTQPLKITDISRRGEDTLSIIRPDGLIPLPPPYDRAEALPPVTELTPDQKSRLASDLDGFCALALLRSTAGQKETVERFIAGVSKLLSKDDNWTFLQPLLLSLDHCARCQTCSDACHVYLASGKNELYRPIYRSEVFRRIVNKYARPAGGLLSKLRGDIELNFTVISRLYELAYRCNLCRRCAQACPMGVDNALITREIRKLFSQELGWAPQELHEKGTVLQLTAGSPTGMRPGVAVDNMRFLEEEFGEATGINFTVPWDRTGAEVLFIPSAGDIISNPEGVIAIAILAEGAGISWTLSSEISGYEATNYGLFYDDFQLARIATRHARIARGLKVKRIVIGECGHAHKALLAAADRLLTGDLNIPRESIFTFLESIVFSGKIRFDPSRNSFPVTLHDPCNVVRNLGIVMPQRRILHFLCPLFREMTPCGVDNYCCGGGGGLGIISNVNFGDWKMLVSGRMKLKQLLETFADNPAPEVRKYVCAPCLNCRMQLRDLISYYGAKEKSGIFCGGLAELIVNAMVTVRKPFINWGD